MRGRMEDLDVGTVMTRLEGSREEIWDGEGYMRVKKKKLREQFADIEQKKASDIFSGVTVYVNGWTQPNADEIKHLVHAHGGHYEYNLYGDTAVTHTIATHLPHAKIRNLKEGAVVCTPDWVVDSVAAGRRLPEETYLLYSSHSRGQKKLKFMPKSSTEIKDESEQLESKEMVEGMTTSVRSSLEALVPKPKPSIPQRYDSSRGAAFVNDYFTYSRLHHLSKWSTELKEFTSHTLPQVNQKYPKLQPEALLRGKKQRLIAHVDVDCFFVSVSLRERPQLRGRPVAVCHAKLPGGKSGDNMEQTEGSFETANSEGLDRNENRPHPEHLLKSTSDIASCSYEARAAGVKNGMSVGKALNLCPDLQLVPYEFDKYHKVSKTFYTILMSYSSSLEPVSCDEAYLELTDYISCVSEAERMIKEMRDEVERATGCTVSAGVAHNMLLARMATRVAKPNGQHFLSLDGVAEFMRSQRVKDLPGVGYSTSAKLREIGVETCGQLQEVPLSQLKSNFGSKNGQALYDHSRGKDERQLKMASERKSISVDLNYGLRFQSQSEAETLLQNLTQELQKRANEAGVVGGTLTLKLMIRKPDAPTETAKFLGHGRCNNVSRSCQLLQPTAESEELLKLSLRLLKQIQLRPEDIRGVGVQLTRLVSSSSSSSSSSNSHADLRTLFVNSENPNSKSKHSVSVREKVLPPLPDLDLPASNPQIFGSEGDRDEAGTRGQDESGVRDPDEASTRGLDETFNLDLPPVSQLDSSVLSALPPDLADKILCSYTKKEEEEKKMKKDEEGDIFGKGSVTNGSKQNSPIKTLGSSTEGGLPKQGRGRGRGSRGRGRGKSSPLKSPSKQSKTANSNNSPVKQTRLLDFIPQTRNQTDNSGKLDKPLNIEGQPQLISDHHTLTSSDRVTKEDPATTSHEVTVLVNGDQLVGECRENIKGWIRDSPNGPLNQDLEIVTDYFVELCERGLPSLFVILRGFRRMVLTSGASGWTCTFNTVLKRVQAEVVSLHKATLPIEPIIAV